MSEDATTSKVRKAILDGAIALEDIRGTDGWNFIMRTLEKLEIDVMRAAFEADDADLAHFRGVRAGIVAVRVALGEAIGQGGEIAADTDDQEEAERLGLRFGSGEFA